MISTQTFYTAMLATLPSQEYIWQKFTTCKLLWETLSLSKSETAAHPDSEKETTTNEYEGPSILGQHVLVHYIFPHLDHKDVGLMGVVAKEYVQLSQIPQYWEQVSDSENYKVSF